MTFTVGDRVVLREGRGVVSAEIVSGWGSMEVSEGETLEVTRVATQKFIGRKNNESAWFHNMDFVLEYPELASGTEPKRRPGDVPEGQLSPHDPRLEWFWDDVSEVIARSNYCSQVDSVLAAVQAPPRKRKFEARGEIAGIVIRSEVMARTQEEANAKLVAALLAAREVSE